MGANDHVEVVYVGLGKLTVFAISEHELRQMEAGHLANRMETLCCSCVTLALPTFAGLFLVDVEKQKTAFLVALVLALCALGFAVLFGFLWRHHATKRQEIFDEIRERKAQLLVAQTDVVGGGASHV